MRVTKPLALGGLAVPSLQIHRTAEEMVYGREEKDLSWELYVYRRDVLSRLTVLAPTPREREERLEQLRALGHGIRIRVVITPYASRGVDTPSDLAALERDWEALTGPAESGRKGSLR